MSSGPSLSKHPTVSHIRFLQTFFVDEILPSLLPHFRPPRKKLDQLVDRGTFKHALSARRRLWGFSKTSPSGIHGTIVQEAFKPFQSGVRRVVNAIKRGKPTVALCNNTEGESSFEKRTQESLPDAFFLPVSHSFGPAQWADIAVIGEYQVENNEQNVQEVFIATNHALRTDLTCDEPKNIKKMSRSLLNCMQKDPRRRFAFGFTAEDANIKLWYCDRSQIVVSDPFDFREDYHTLLRFILSLSFAELHQLGWDPTMQEIHVDGHVQYDITVRSAEAQIVVYRTLGLLSDSSARDLLGRGTRVWKAVRLVEGEEVGPPVALKDAWVDNTRQREGNNLSQVLEADFAKEHPELNEHLMKVQTHGDVFVAGIQDHTPSFLQPDSSSTVGKSTRVVENGSHKEIPTPVTLFQVHYRIVYQEAGKSLAEVDSLQTVFKALAEALYGLLTMHKSGWVHRDLSPGNIVIVDGAARVIDLEYATSERSPNPLGKTGTLNFVPVEVASGKYLFRVDTLKTLDKTWNPPVFGYNPLHDLEALWWIAVYYTVNREVEIVDEEAADTQGDIEEQRGVAEDFFYDLETRQTVFLFNGYFAKQLQCLHPSLAEVAEILEDIRAILWEGYTNIEESTEPINFDVAEPLYGHMCVRLQEAAEHSEKLNIRIRRFKDIN
ncbi:hypothetical protein NM688_g1888 [Phlebia brevispora]|uniref:Uncharacterized protein n=1 Tax=Phlebia brevispora TaxID=194682 RepID=A0ACC1T9X7_9APHY|nr:hypothetical protein NM688_g1888 [Phlebia brevispora]